MIDPLYTASGLLVGTLVGLTGIGGGSLMTPLLILAFGVHPATAVGTDLLFAACTKMVGATIYAGRQTIDWRITGRLLRGSMPAMVLSIGLLSLFKSHVDQLAPVITLVLGLVLLLTAALLIFQKQAIRMLPDWTAEGPGRLSRLTSGAGAVLGVLVSFSSVGAGALGVTALTVLYPKQSLVRIVGSDIAHAIPLTLLAGCGYWSLGLVDWHLLASLLTGSVPGIILGSLIATMVPVPVLRTILALTLSLSAARLIFG